MSEQKEQEPIISFLQLTENNVNAFVKMVDVTRKHGSLEEADLALDFLKIVLYNKQLTEKQLNSQENTKESNEVTTE